VESGANLDAASERLGIGVGGTSLVGIGGRPFVDLEPLLAPLGVLDALDEVHDEVCLALARLPWGMTGGSHRSMGIMPERLRHEALVDYGEVIASMSDAEYATLRDLADEPDEFPARRDGAMRFGEEREVPLGRRQLAWLKVRFGVYFPWKAYLELIPNQRWEEKTERAGKAFTATARAAFPRLVALAERLPLRWVGRCNVMGLEAHDHGTVHRDGDPGEPDPFIMLCPNNDKRLYLYDEAHDRRHYVGSRAFWFNDRDFHGVAADPFFRYSIRVDGPFTDEFRASIAAVLRAERGVCSPAEAK
jgi:hypothetical protein